MQVSGLRVQACGRPTGLREFGSSTAAWRPGLPIAARTPRPSDRNARAMVLISGQMTATRDMIGTAPVTRTERETAGVEGAVG